METFRRISLTFSSFFLVLLAGASIAGPTGEQVVSGTVVVSRPDAVTTQIQQSTEKGIINWQDFSLQSGEKAQFIQPGSTSITLNRVVGANPSYILGQISANGQVILINRAGVLFGQSATVNVAGLIATTADIMNSDFNSGRYQFTQEAGTTRGIIQEGAVLTPEGGNVLLLAPHVENTGVIQANLGKVALSSGTKYTVDFNGDDLVHFEVNPNDVGTPVDSNGKVLSRGIINKGTITANGGRVLMSTQAAQNAVSQVTNYGGVIEANTIQNKQGTIILSGGTGSEVSISGTLSAQGKNTGEKGGTIKVLGEKVSVGKEAPATINASGKAGGGTILIGGNYQGKGPEANAKETTVSSTSTLLANATEKGNGGKVVVYSEGKTEFHGAAQAKGGPQGGNGGLVETSGNQLDVSDAKIDASAPQGQSGTWLLDPADVNIDAAMAASLAAALKTSTTVNVNADNSITVSAPIQTEEATHNAWLNLTAGETIDIFSSIIGNFGLKLFAGRGLDEDLPSQRQEGTINPNAEINVYDFNLERGVFAQLSSGIGTLPKFNARNNFNIGLYASFQRGIQTGASIGITDVYGLQGADGVTQSYFLLNDIDASPSRNWTWSAKKCNSGVCKGFTPLMRWHSLPFFIATLEGNNHTISNLYINAPGEDFIGLFQRVGNGTNPGSIINVGMVNSSITGRNYVGGIAGTAINSIFTNVYNTGSVMGSSYVGGLIGSTAQDLIRGGNNISQSYNTGFISGTGNYVGGIVGNSNNEFLPSSSFHSNTLTNVYNLGSVSGSGYVGGIIGNNSSGAITTDYFTNIYNAGYVSGDSGSTGAIVGSAGQFSTDYRNMIWNTETSGPNSSGVLSGSIGRTTAEMMQLASYSGWSADIWGIIEGSSYPYFKWRYPTTTPQVVSGTAASSFGQGKPIVLAVNGTLKNIAYTGKNGFFYNLLDGDTYGSDSSKNLLLVYSNNPSQFGNSLMKLNSSDPITNLSLITDTLKVESQGNQVVSNTDLVNARPTSVESPSAVLYSTSGQTITLPDNKHLLVKGNTPFHLTGNISTGGLGNITFESNSSGGLTLSGNPILTGHNIDIERMIRNSPSGGSSGLTLNAGDSGNILFADSVGTASDRLSWVDIINAHDVENRGALYTDRFTQESGTGKTYFSGKEFGMHFGSNPGSGSLYADTVNVNTTGLTGRVFTDRLVFSPFLLYADLASGGINGQVGVAGAAEIVSHLVYLNFGPGKYFYDNIDLYDFLFCLNNPNKCLPEKTTSEPTKRWLSMVEAEHEKGEEHRYLNPIGVTLPDQKTEKK